MNQKYFLDALILIFSSIFIFPFFGFSIKFKYALL